MPDPVFPLGLAWVNGALLRAGYATRWIDFQTDSFHALEQTLAEFQPDFIGLSLRNIDDVLIRERETYFGEFLSLCGSLRQRTTAPLILGGSGFSIYPERLLELAEADYGICGEGEHSLVALIRALESGDGPGPIPGLVRRGEQAVMRNGASLADLSQDTSLPVRPERLVAHYLKTSGMLNVQTQRGCPHGCCFCAYPVLEGRLWRQRPAEAVAEEMAELERAGARYVFIVDSVFNSSATHVTAVCEALLRRGLRLRWGCFLRPQGLTRELMRLMARAGLAHIEFGTDSFCDEVLSEYGKAFRFEDVLQAAELARREQIEQCHFLIVGGPGESVATLQTSFRNSLRLGDVTIMAITGMRIYPGTPLSHRAQAEGVVEPGSDLLAPVYYVAPGLTTDEIFEILRRFVGQSPNWIAGHPPPAYQQLVERLRQRGVVGPLWSYVPPVQRLWQQAAV